MNCLKGILDKNRFIFSFPTFSFCFSIYTATCHYNNIHTIQTCTISICQLYFIFEKSAFIFFQLVFHIKFVYECAFQCVEFIIIFWSYSVIISAVVVVVVVVALQVNLYPFCYIICIGICIVVDVVLHSLFVNIRNIHSSGIWEFFFWFQLISFDSMNWIEWKIFHVLLYIIQTNFTFF